MVYKKDIGFFVLSGFALKWCDKCDAQNLAWSVKNGEENHNLLRKRDTKIKINGIQNFLDDLKKFRMENIATDEVIINSPAETLGDTNIDWNHNNIVSAGTAKFEFNKSAKVGEDNNTDDETTYSKRTVCATPPFPENLAEYTRSVENLHRNHQFIMTSDAHIRESGSVVIPVWFHVITNTQGKGTVSDKQLDEQIALLNNAFSGKEELSCSSVSTPSYTGADSPFRFLKVGVNRVVNDDYFVATINKDQNMKVLRKGGCETLNIYTNEPAGNNLLGYASYPQDCKNYQARDGVVIKYSTIPYGGEELYGSGDTTVHEVGHWLGLRHTFHNGCDGGDGIADTPPQAQPSSGCLKNYNTCGGLGFPGQFDPVFNYMDYSYDCCTFMFTPGQIEEMDYLHKTYREEEGGVSYTLHPTAAPTARNCIDSSLVKIIIKPDNYPTETSWNIKDLSGNIMVSSGKKAEEYQNCFPEDCYTFTIEDTQGDGMCCSYGTGKYEVYWKNELVGSGGAFTFTNVVKFGCPEPCQCKVGCYRKRFASMEWEKRCLVSICAGCPECDAWNYSCSQKCLKDSSNPKQLTKLSWTEKCGKPSCAGCSVCNCAASD